jgi:hypothetical protein
MIFLLSIVSGILYRAGGLSKEEKTWIPVWMRHSWVRDWLCPLCIYSLYLPSSWFQFGMWLCAYGATGGMLSTYWDWTNKGNANYWLSGFMVGLAGLFLIALGVPWWHLLARSLALAVCWGAWCAIFKNADVEEYSRGAFLVLTMIGV